MCGGKNYFPIERENWTLEKAPKTRHNTIQNSRHHHRVAAGAQRAFEGHTTRKKHARTQKSEEKDVVVLRARTNEPNDDDLGAARTGIRDGEPGDGIPRGLVQQTRPLVLREMHR